MHDQPSLDGYEWPVCVTPRCKRQLWIAEAGRWACRPCEDATATRISELPALFRRLDTTAMLTRGARNPGAGTTGSRTPPIPPRLDVLNLVGPGGIAARLRDIEDAWRSALSWTIAPWRGNPAEAIPHHARFLTDNLLWACSSYESVGQDIADLRRLHAQCKALTEQKPKTGQVKIGLCPVQIDDQPCGTQLTASTRSFKTTCPTCDTSWEGEQQWRVLRRAQEQVTAETAQTAA
ncbi:hypothetical protein F7R91_14635 [Streptomyces luteolifulvus]|uniref:Uncharacterized protein n=1 Tax=Streptomyces luteolifulvus TaxID=2615112 RepID=A0A6H9UZY7_9ACTN|nr:hypothetical protein [Streptomyces luteolifulvus]KAB1146811.1 hypothetical protein F7R91_14635 [Streptomyces luteolifulvus]